AARWSRRRDLFRCQAKRLGAGRLVIAFGDEVDDRKGCDEHRDADECAALDVLALGVSAGANRRRDRELRRAALGERRSRNQARGGGRSNQTTLEHSCLPERHKNLVRDRSLTRPVCSRSESDDKRGSRVSPYVLSFCYTWKRLGERSRPAGGAE